MRIRKNAASNMTLVIGLPILPMSNQLKFYHPLQIILALRLRVSPAGHTSREPDNHFRLADTSIFGTFTIGSPRTLNDVLIRTGHPVLAWKLLISA